MGTVVPLARARKARAKLLKKATADQNAALHGLPKAEKALQKAKLAQQNSQLDGHKRTP
ncbi:MAG: DUF4169 family protein [Paracoccaceae bacterium]|jgi:hypothetical protein|nr:DUF4169 family protein [Paracoccaceae bacterium]MDP5345846.1 DUF4169 family protein [Paracoccaceae bacterium]